MTDVADWPASPWCDSRSTVDAGVSGRFPLDLNRSIASPTNHGKPQSHGASAAFEKQTPVPYIK